MRCNDGPGPYKVSMMVFSVVGGALSLPPIDATPTSVTMVTDRIMVTVWSVMLLLGAALVLTGALWNGRLVTALGLERIGLAAHLTACAVYALALGLRWDGNSGAVVVTTFVAALAIADVWRICQLTSCMRRLIRLSDEIAGKEGE